VCDKVIGLKQFPDIFGMLESILYQQKDEDVIWMMRTKNACASFFTAQK
jgi:hypothetical protein